jgi:hypothetical protein
MRTITAQSAVRLLHVFLGRNQLILLLAQTFGVDLEARARADRKRVPIVVTTILTFLDNRESLQIGFTL